jgi:hypothetical protein
VRRDLGSAQGVRVPARLADEAVEQHPGAGPAAALGDAEAREVGDPLDPVRVAGRHDDALLAAPEVHEDRPAVPEDAGGERRVVGAVAMAEVQRRRVRAPLPQRREAAEAPRRPDALGAGGDAVQQRIVAARQPQRAVAM